MGLFDKFKKWPSTEEIEEANQEADEVIARWTEDPEKPKKED